MKKCILCEEELDTEVTNLEHYVPAVAIRNFDKLRIPKSMNWALRQNYCDEQLEEKILVPISDHKKWATVRVHKRCNQDASHMCEDLKYIIDHLEQDIPDRKFKSLIMYYSYLWDILAEDLVVEIFSKKDVDDRFRKTQAMQMYSKGLLDLGSIKIRVKHPLINDQWTSGPAPEITYDNEPGVEQHWIWIGTENVLRED